MSAQATGLTDGSTTQVRVFFNAFQIVNDQAVSTVAGDFVPSITVSGVTCNAIEDTNDLDGDVRTTHYFDFDCTVGNNGASLTASVSDGTNSGTVDLAAGITLAAQSTLYNSSASHLRVIATAGNTFDATADIAKKSDTSPCYQNIPQYKILTGWLSVSQVGKDVTLKCSCITGVSSYKFEFKVNSFTDVNGNGYYDSKDTLGPEIVPWTTVNHNASGYTLSTLEIGQIVTWQVTAIGTENYASSDIGIATSTQGYNPFMVKDYLLEPAGFTVVQQPSYYYKLDWNDAVTKNGNAFTPSFSVYYTIEGLNNADGTPKRFNATKSDKISENTINISYANQQYTIAGKKILFEVTAVGNSAAAGIAGSPTAYYEYTIVDNLTAPDMTVQSKTEDSIVVTWNAVPNAKEYKVIYGKKEGFTSASAFNAVVDKDACTATASNLELATEYTFKMQAIVDTGNGNTVVSLELNKWATKKIDVPTLGLPVQTATAVASAYTPGCITVSWEGDETAVSEYIVYWSKNSDKTDSSHRVVPKSNAKTLIINSLDAATDYYIWVEGKYTDTTKTSVSADVSGPVKTFGLFGSTPTGLNLTQTPDTTNITFTWTPVSDANSYILSYSADNGLNWTSESISQNSSIIVTKAVTAGQIYQWNVRAVKDGTPTSYSEAASGSSLTITSPLETPVLKEAETVVTDSTITLKWDSVDNASDYVIEYKTETGEWSTNNVVISQLGETSVYQAIISDLAEGTSYSIHARSVATTGGDYVDSAFSSPAISVKTLATLATPQLNAVTSDLTTVVLSWTVVANKTGYAVQYKIATDEAWNDLPTVVTEETYSFTSLSADHAYSFRVKANGSEDRIDSDWSNTKTQLNRPVVPSGGIVGTTGGFTIDWNAIPNASQYKVVWNGTGDSGFGTTVETTYGHAVPDDSQAYTIAVAVQALSTDTLYFESWPTDSCNVVTLKKVPLPPDKEVYAEPVSTTQVVVEWEAVENPANLGVTGYTIAYAPKDSPEDVRYLTINNPNEATVTLTGLAPDTEYEITIYAKTDSLPQDPGTGYGDTIVGRVQAKTEDFVPEPLPFWDVTGKNFKFYLFDMTEVSPDGTQGSALLYGFSNTGNMIQIGNKYMVNPNSVPTLQGAKHSSETFLISSAAEKFFKQIIVLGSGMNNLYTARDKLVLQGTDSVKDTFTINNGETIPLVNGHRIYGTGLVSIANTNSEGDSTDNATIAFVGMKQVLISASGNSNTFKVNGLSTAISLLGRGTEQTKDNTLDFSQLQVIRDTATGVVLSLNDRAVSTIAGQVGNIRLYGEYRNIIGSNAVDTIISGEYGITFTDETGSRSVVNLSRSEQSNTVTLKGDRSVIIGSKANDTIVVAGDYMTVNVTRGGHNLVKSQGNHNTILAGDGNDEVSVAGSSNLVNTGGGNDRVFIKDTAGIISAKNRVFLGSGDDILDASAASGDLNYFYAGSGNDMIIGTQGNDYIFGNSGTNVLVGQEGIDRIFGGCGNDLIAGCSFAALDDLLFTDAETSGFEKLAQDIAAVLNESNVTRNAIEDVTRGEQGMSSRTDEVKDWLYRGGGKTHAFFSDHLDYAQALDNHNFNDELFVVDID